MSNQHSFDADIKNVQTIIANFKSNHTFNVNMITVHSFLLAVSGLPIFATFAKVDIKQKFGKITISNIIATMKASANVLIKSPIITIVKTMLTINPRVNVYAGRNFSTNFLYQFIRIAGNIPISIKSEKLNVILRERIKPKGTAILVNGANISAIPIVRQYNHIYNVSGCTINQVKTLTINEFVYTII